MINAGLQVRPAVLEDQPRISSLIQNEITSHRHLDWRVPLEWLGSSHYWVLEENGLHIRGVLACPEDPPRVAWIRLFAYSQANSNPFTVSRLLRKQPEAWSLLWERARREVIDINPQAVVAGIAVKPWFQEILSLSGFELKQQIVLLQWSQTEFRDFQAPGGIRIRPMIEGDLPAVTDVDLEAFGWFWHNTLDSLRRAFSQSVSATVAEDGSGILGYQISTGSMFGAHLARLAVRGQAQGRGVGSALVGGMIQSLDPAQRNRLSVNTQSDNDASLALYKKIGFVRTGETFPVYIYPGHIHV